MRAIWKGSISFGLVNIPVALYSATRAGKQIKFRLLRKADQSEVRYKRVAVADEKEVPWEEIVKGYEYEKGQFVVMNEKDFEKVNLTSNHTVDIREFVSLDEIDPMFFDEPYLMAPEKGGEKAYALLRDALKKSGKVGVAKVILKTREHLAAVKPMGEGLILELMHFSEELRDPKELKLPEIRETGAKELQMAEMLIKSMTDKWKPEKYHDDYTEALEEIIQAKVESGGKPLPSPKAKKPSGKVVDLVAILQESLKQTQGKKPSKPQKAPAKKAA